MKKVSIITMHRVLNYGSILQTVALSCFLKQYGYEVEIIDYLFPNAYHKTIASKTSVPESAKSRLDLHLNGLCARILNQKSDDKISKFNKFLQQYLTLSRAYNTEEELKQLPPNADIYLTGSDQVWNPRYIGTDSSFFLQWVPKSQNSAKIAYGASFGNSNLPEDFKDLIFPWLKEYSYLFVREDNSLLEQLRTEYKIVLDPTLLLDKRDWMKFMNPKPLVKQRYLLCYLLGYSFDSVPYATKLMDYIHKKTGYKIVMIDGEPKNILKGYRLFNNIGPEEFLNLFYHAEMILTTSFHGTAFAINFGKPFLSLVDDKKDTDTRQISLIKILGLVGNNCVVRNNTPLREVTFPKYDGQYKQLLNQTRNLSRQYLLNALKNVEDSQRLYQV